MLLQLILKLSISLAIVWLFYQCVLRRLTFYGANRWYLTGYSILCCFIPFININPFLESSKLDKSRIVDLFPSVEKYTGSIQDLSHQPLVANVGRFDQWDWLALIFIAGTAFFLLQFFIRWISFLKMRRKAQLISTEGIRLYQVNDSIIPFSFGNSVFINASLHTESELQEIVLHEFVHVKNRHTFDILWSEWLCIINWYNPFAWLLKSSIRQNLEFIADNKVLEEGLDKKHYQYLLLKVIGNNHFSIAPKFNFSSLKKRIAMMNKFKSARISALRFLFLVPLLSVLLLAFRRDRQVSDLPVQAPQANPVPSASAAIPVEVQEFNHISKSDTAPVVPLNDKSYFVDLRGKGKNKTVVVRDKDGNEVKRIPLDVWNKKVKEYTGLYGDFIPPSPPPQPPTPPTKPENPDRDIASLDFNEQRVATIELKNGTVERYDLKDEEEGKTFERKYGKIITVPPKKTGTIVSVTDGEDVAAVATKVATTSNSVASTSVNVVSSVSEPVKVARVKAKSTGGGHTVIAPMPPIPGETGGIVGDYIYTIPGKEDILATITKKTTQAELDELKKQLKEKGITLTFEIVEYNAKGRLVNVYGSMKSGDGSTNFVAKDFSKLILSIVKDGDRTYFKVTVTENKATI